MLKSAFFLCSVLYTVSCIIYGTQARAEDISCELDISTISHTGTTFKSKKKSRFGGIFDVITDLKILQNGEHSDGIFCDFNFGQSIDNQEHLPFIYKAYLYHIFDYAGEIKIGCDRNAVFYTPMIDGELDNYGYNRVKHKYIFPNLHNQKLFFAENYIKGSTDNSPKILWISPTIRGCKVTASFTPDADKDILFKNKNEKIFAKNVISFGLSYEKGDPDGYNYKLLCGSNFGQAKDANLRSLNSYLLGAGFGYKIFQIDFNYLNNGYSLSQKSAISDEGKAYKCRVVLNFEKFRIFAGGCFSKKSNIFEKKSKIIEKKVGGELFVNDLLTFICEYRTIKTYTTTLKRIGGRQQLLVAGFVLKKDFHFF